MIGIVEILGRSEQGVTRPFICRGEDGNTYFVKGIGAGRRSQVCEWIAGNLASELNLPVAPFEIVQVPEELAFADTEYGDLGVGPAFGSLKQTIMELSYALVEDVPPALKRRVLAFDWWIRNNDRMLTEKGGNPNLFWAPEEERLVIIDHNQAFDSNFSIEDFFAFHVFSRSCPDLFGDAFYQQEYINAFQAALDQWHNICSGIPIEWRFQDAELTVKSDVDLDDMFTILNRCNSDNFWDHA